MAFWSEVAYLAEMASALESAVCISRVEMHRFHCVSGVSADTSQCDCVRNSIRLCGFDEAWLGVFLSQA